MKVLCNVIPERTFTNRPKSYRKSKFTRLGSLFYAFNHIKVTNNPYFAEILESRLVALKILRTIHLLYNAIYLVPMFLCMTMSISYSVTFDEHVSDVTSRLIDSKSTI